MKNPKKILIANRGVIAIRALRAAKELGYQVASVYSTVDKDQKHLKLSDEAICIGPAASKESYLNEAAIISAAELVGADAIYPGFGFLAENASFAEKCKESGFEFIGPDPKVIDVMGDKVKAKELIESLGVPTVPGYTGQIQSQNQIENIVEEIGYPVIVKASSGGGGKGMRVVYDKSELWDSIIGAQNEAKLAFGNDEVFIEKYLKKPRHIEIQIFGDGKGKVVHLYSRDCSLQRKYQKIVEEAPAKNLNQEKLDEIQNICVKACSELNYKGAGTLEFLYEDNEFFFIEMNTRIQVEHTVTEEVTGIDIVQAQILIAEGKTIAEATGKENQSEVILNGHALQTRITTEDPQNNFIPDYGRITAFRSATGMGIRLDGGTAYAGGVITRYYDSLLVKVTAWAPTPSKAIARMDRALSEGFKDMEVDELEPVSYTHLTLPTSDLV